MNVGDKIDFAYTGSPQEFVAPYEGMYQLEVWGAEGGGLRLSGNTNSGDGGRGGYAKGTVTLKRKQPLHVYVGGHGLSSIEGIAEGGWNGGGCAWATSNTEPANGGGGATDIRLIGGEWDNPQGLLSRIIVAGAGGGGGEDGGETGGFGGGATGSSSFGGTQSSSGGGAVFGKGAHTPNDGGGGGGGWFGGGTTNGSQNRPTTNSTSDTGATASGGSGYVLDANSWKPTGYVATSDFYMINTQNIFGSLSIPLPTGTGTQTGNIGHGYARITLIEKFKSPIEAKCKVNGHFRDVETMLVKVNGHWREVEQIAHKKDGHWMLPK